MEYVIVYTSWQNSSRTSCLLFSRVNIFLQGNVQRITPTSPMQVSIDESIAKSLESLVMNVIHVGGIVGKVK